MHLIWPTLAHGSRAHSGARGPDADQITSRNEVCTGDSGADLQPPEPCAVCTRALGRITRRALRTGYSERPCTGGRAGGMSCGMLGGSRRIGGRGAQEALSDHCWAESFFDLSSFTAGPLAPG